MQKKFPLHPPHPERNCWGCDQYCPAGSLICGNGSERTQHPVELFGDDWASEGIEPLLVAPDPAPPAAAATPVEHPVRWHRLAPDRLDGSQRSPSSPPTGG
jgi:hypothetical protein